MLILQGAELEWGDGLLPTGLPRLVLAFTVKPLLRILEIKVFKSVFCYNKLYVSILIEYIFFNMIL